MWDGINKMCTEVLMSFDLESELDEGVDPQVEVLNCFMLVLYPSCTKPVRSIRIPNPE